MKCVICVSETPYNLKKNAQTVKIDANTAFICACFCKALKISFEKYSARLYLSIMCDMCQAKIEQIFLNEDSGQLPELEENIDNLKSTLLEGYLNGMQQEGEDVDQVLRFDILKELGMVVELANQDDENTDSNEGSQVIDSYEDLNEESQMIYSESNNVDNFDDSIMETDVIAEPLVEEKFSPTKSDVSMEEESLNREETVISIAQVNTASCTVEVENILVESQNTDVISQQKGKKKKKKKTITEGSKKASSSSSSSKTSVKLRNGKIRKKKSLKISTKFKNRLRQKSKSLKSSGTTTTTSSLKSKSKILKNSSRKRKHQSNNQSDNEDAENRDVRKKKKYSYMRPSKNRKGQDFVAICKYPGCGRRYTDSKLREIHHKRVHEGDRNAYCCDLCPKKFCSKARLARHIEKHNEPTEYLCTFENCDLKFKSKKMLDFHLLKHGDNFPFKCEICGHGFIYSAKLDAHKKLAHLTETTVQCPICPRQFKSKQYLTIHLKGTHPPPKTEQNDYACDQCPARYKRFRSLQEHLRMHTNDLPFACPFENCDLRFPWKGRLTRHIKLRHEDSKPFDCKTCGMSFKQESNLKIHEMRHDESNRKFKCELCDLKFFDAYKLKYHQSVHTQEKPYVCTFDDTCKRSFRLKNALKKHISVVHEKKKDFECELCHKKFLTKVFVQYHQAAKHPELEQPKFACDIEGCEKSFAEPSSLRVHKRTNHYKDLPIACELCPSRFLFPSRLKKHMRNQHSTERKKCNICNRNFAIDNLKRHMARHEKRKSKKKKKEESDDEEEEEEDDESGEEEEDEEESSSDEGESSDEESDDSEEEEEEEGSNDEANKK